SFVSSANSSTNARPARIACEVGAMMRQPSRGQRSTKTVLRMEMSASGATGLLALGAFFR
ncbi:MAG: hypothetical protein ACKPHU_00780, partial [Planctomycetaceae bacterium]